MGSADVNQAGFFNSGDHLNRKSQSNLSFLHKLLRIARYPQGIGGDGSHLLRPKAPQALPKASDCVQTPLHRFIIQHLTGG